MLYRRIHQHLPRFPLTPVQQEYGQHDQLPNNVLHSRLRLLFHNGLQTLLFRLQRHNSRDHSDPQTLQFQKAVR